LRLGPSNCLSLVADNVIPVRGGLSKRFLKELADEWSGEGEDENLQE
jgi:hypothetical protein